MLWHIPLAGSKRVVDVAVLAMLPGAIECVTSEAVSERTPQPDPWMRAGHGLRAVPGAAMCLSEGRQEEGASVGSLSPRRAEERRDWRHQCLHGGHSMNERLNSHFGCTPAPRATLHPSGRRTPHRRPHLNPELSNRTHLSVTRRNSTLSRPGRHCRYGRSPRNPLAGDLSRTGVGGACCLLEGRRERRLDTIPWGSLPPTCRWCTTGQSNP